MSSPPRYWDRRAEDAFKSAVGRGDYGEAEGLLGTPGFDAHGLVGWLKTEREGEGRDRLLKIIKEGFCCYCGGLVKNYRGQYPLWEEEGGFKGGDKGGST
jgi:hypothetical protein